MDQHITIKINEEIVPHNGKPITRIAVSPQSKYVVTYSQEDKSFVGWRNNNKDNQEDKNRKKNHNQNKSLYNFNGWLMDNKNEDNRREDIQVNNSGPFIFDDKVQAYKLNNLGLDILDFKVSDEKIIMYEGDNKLGNFKLYVV